MRNLAPALILLTALAFPAAAEDPKAPEQRVTDNAGILKELEVKQLESQLRKLSGYELAEAYVYIAESVPATEELETYTLRLMNAWELGDEELKDGLVIFVFVKDRKMRIEVGLGLEEALPNEAAKHIIDIDLKPAFRDSRYAYGLLRAIDSIARALDLARSRAE